MIKQLRALDKPKERREKQLFLVEGYKMTAEAVAAGMCRTLLVQSDRISDYQSIIDSAMKAGVECIAVPENAIRTLSTANSPQGICCAASLPEEPAVLDGDLIIALDGVQDPGNAGTILRTADAAGYDGAILGSGSADPFGPKALRATMGAVFRVPIRQTADLRRELTGLLNRGYALIATELGGADFFEGCPAQKSVLIIGNEGNGISHEISALSTHHLALPMYGGAESLNAAIAAGIMIYELSRQHERRKKHD